MFRLWRLVTTTLRIIFKYRVANLAAEVAFFTLLALPPLVLGLAAVAGLVTGKLGLSDRKMVEDGLTELVQPFLTKDVVDSVIVPTFHQAVTGSHYGLISIGFVLSLWSGSRAMNTYVDTITIMYGLGGERGFFRQRALAFGIYLLALTAGTVAVPLLVIGPQTLAGWLPRELDWVADVYWPAVALSTALLLAVLYHVAVPVKTRWLFNLPGALVALATWFGASVVMRLVLSVSIGGTSIYGPLAAPIIVLIWLYLIAIAVLIGAALNAGIEQVWPRQSAATATPSLVTRKIPRQPPPAELGK